MIERAKALAQLALAFGRVERVTRHEDGVRPETDTDHTVMLAVVACDLAPPDLDAGRIAQYAIVHDLVEAITGDVQTLTIDAAGRVAKEAREAAALAQLVERFGRDSWLGATLVRYEEQADAEARYVRLVDKVLPKLTHLFNGCIAARQLTDIQGFIASHEAQRVKLLAQYGGDPRLLPALALLHEAMVASEAAWPRSAQRARTPRPVVQRGASGLACAVYEAVVEEPWCTAQDLAEQLGRTAATIGSALYRLVLAGRLVRRRRAPGQAWAYRVAA